MRSVLGEYGFGAAHEPQGQPVKAVVKWFNVTKGFGFVAPTDGSSDAFLHISVLNRAGMQEIAEGTEILCTLGSGQKGQQVMQIIEVTGMAEVPQSSGRGDRGGFGGGRDRDRGGFGGGRDRDRGGFGGGDYGGGGFGGDDYGSGGGYNAPSGPVTETTGTVKWFKPDKGFGFVAPDDGGKDVFVHKSLLRRCGILILDPGQRVQMKVQEGGKGREASWIAAAD